MRRVGAAGSGALACELTWAGAMIDVGDWVSMRGRQAAKAGHHWAPPPAPAKPSGARQEVRRAGGLSGGAVGEARNVYGQGIVAVRTVCIFVGFVTPNPTQLGM